MIDHIGIGAKDFQASRHFYTTTLATLGISPIIEITADQSGGYHGIGYGRGDKPFFWLGNGGPRGTGMHVAFTAASRSHVDLFYSAALSSGGKDNGAPGLRPHYHPNYYGAFIYDPDGINVEAVCHSSK
jgi:catechol 2,3-dioxygenase-like lactoylglutathione lyase family enzyme